MTWQSALWVILHHQTTSVKWRNTGEKRQVTSISHMETPAQVWLHDDSQQTLYFCNSFSLPPFQEAMRHLTGLLPEGLKQEIYGLWEVFCIPDACYIWRITELMWQPTHMCLLCRNMRPRPVQRPGWWKSLTSWRWSCRLMSTRSWRGRQEDYKSSLTPPTVCLRDRMICLPLSMSFLFHISMYLSCSHSLSIQYLNMKMIFDL